MSPRINVDELHVHMAAADMRLYPPTREPDYEWCIILARGISAYGDTEDIVRLVNMLIRALGLRGLGDQVITPPDPDAVEGT